MLFCGGRVVDHLTQDPKIKGLNLATCARREKVVKRVYLKDNKCCSADILNYVCQRCDHV